jgi:hypothetical protein
MPLARVAMEAGTYFDLDQQAARQELGDEVIVANVRELRAISHSDRKNDQVEADGMDEEQAEQAQKRRLKLISANGGKSGLDGCDGD